MSKILESLFAYKLIKLILYIQCNANLSYANTVDEMYYNSSIVPTCMLFFSMPPTSIIFLAVPQPLESRTVPVCKEKFCKQTGEIWSYLPNGQVILFCRENSDFNTEEL